MPQGLRQPSAFRIVTIRAPTQPYPTKKHPEGVFLNELFERLSQARVRYAVMRNYQTLPDSSGGSDLDILLHPEDASIAKDSVKQAIRSAGGVPIGISESCGFFKIYVLGKTHESSSAWWGIRLDFNVGLYFLGERLLDETAALPTRDHRGIPVLSPGFAGVLGVLKEALNNQMFSTRYAVDARKMAVDDWQQIEVLLAPMGRPALDRLRKLLLSQDLPEELGPECRKLRRDVVRNAYRRHGILAIWHRAKYEWTKIRRYLKPAGIVVAILGVDGAGKSTLINAILPVLNEATHNAVVVRHLRPALLPPLARLKGKKQINTGPVLAPHGSKPSGKIGSIFRLCYLTLDYIIGYWLWTRPRIAKQPTVVIFDRYAYDMAIDPRRFRIGISSRVTSWFAFLAPKPDLIFCLVAEPEKTVARKHELTLEETRRQVSDLRKFAFQGGRAILISTDGTVEQARDAMLHGMLNFLMQRS